MDVATAVIQWLGTNCGKSFLMECDNEIKRRSDLESESEWIKYALKNKTWEDFESSDEINQIATSISDRWGSLESHRSQLKTEILALVQVAISGIKIKDAKKSLSH